MGLGLVEPHIFTVYNDLETKNSYDTVFGTFYDRVACNSVYNRLIWGYSINSFDDLTQEALTWTRDGLVLDVGCGSLAFTAGTYSRHFDRPVILLDQSIKLLRIAKSRVEKINGTVPSNMVFLHGDCLQLPFKPKAFNTIIALNLLHVLSDLKSALNGLGAVLTEDGSAFFTTLVRNNRTADRYLSLCEKSGELVSREVAEIHAAFDELQVPRAHNVVGNMAFIRCGKICG